MLYKTNVWGKKDFGLGFFSTLLKQGINFIFNTSKFSKNLSKTLEKEKPYSCFIHQNINIENIEVS